jgi:protein-L-isoaspartate(D-aspartate) O-methyltransferase
LHRYGLNLMDEESTILEPYALERRQMVADQIERRGLKNPRLLQVFRTVPRHEFVPEELRDRAYDDGPLPIGLGQTISQPYIVALMTSLLELQGDETVLEIGTGSGYQAAILANMAYQVFTIERLPELAENAKATLERLGYRNITVKCADGSLGWIEAAPYRAIMVTAAAAGLPQPLADQLAVGGKLVLPVGDYYGQMLQLWTREPGGMAHENIIPVSFVPLRGKHGWRREDWSGFYEEG